MNDSEKVQNQTDVNKVFPNGIDTEQIELTEGEHVMNVSFQPSGRNDVWDLKRRLAELYDWLIKKCSEAPEDLERYNRKQRCMRIALTHLEHFQMNAVKALTYTREFTGNERYVPVREVPTDGQITMTVAFNAATGDLAEAINYIKNTCANLFDEVQTEMEYRSTDFEKEKKKYITNLGKQSEEDMMAIAQGTFAWSPDLRLNHRKLEHVHGAASEAVFYLRQFQMFAVKAITR